MQILILVYAVACIFGAAVVRGYSGFGFSLLAIISLSLLLPPAEIVPSIFMMEIAASLHLLPSVWRDIHWRALLWLGLGCLLGTPFGVYALANVPAAPMTLALAVFVLVSAVLLARGYALKTMPGPAATFATGAASGSSTAASAPAAAGDPVLLQLARRGAAGRASIIAFFLLTDVTGLAWQGWNGLLTWATLWRAASSCRRLPPGLAGQPQLPPCRSAAFRRWVLRLLMLLAVLTGGRALLQIL
jgi:uncharacterized membrane protein YfcA